jgi:hypothetical protein
MRKNAGTHHSAVERRIGPFSGQPVHHADFAIPLPGKYPPISKDFSQPSTLEILSVPDWQKPSCPGDAFNSVFSVEVMMPPSVA